MVRAGLYDPEGLIPLYGGEHEENGEWWVCTNIGCEDGKKNNISVHTSAVEEVA